MRSHCSFQDTIIKSKRTGLYSGKYKSKISQRQKNLIAFLTLVKLGNKVDSSRPKTDKREAKALNKALDKDQEYGLDSHQDLQMKNCHIQSGQNIKDIHNNYAPHNMSANIDPTNGYTQLKSSKSLELLHRDPILDFANMDYHPLNRLS